MSDQDRLQAITIVIQEIIDRLFLWDVTKDGDNLAGLDANACKLFLMCKDFERVAGSGTVQKGAGVSAPLKRRKTDAENYLRNNKKSNSAAQTPEAAGEGRKDNVVPFRPRG